MWKPTQVSMAPTGEFQSGSLSESVAGEPTGGCQTLLFSERYENMFLLCFQQELRKSYHLLGYLLSGRRQTNPQHHTTTKAGARMLRCFVKGRIHISTKPKIIVFMFAGKTKSMDPRRDLKQKTKHVPHGVFLQFTGSYHRTIMPSCRSQKNITYTQALTPLKSNSPASLKIYQKIANGGCAFTSMFHDS